MIPRKELLKTISLPMKEMVHASTLEEVNLENIVVQFITILGIKTLLVLLMDKLKSQLIVYVD